MTHRANIPLHMLCINDDFHDLYLLDTNELTTRNAFMYMSVSHLRGWHAADSSDHKSQFVKTLKKKKPFDVYQKKYRRARG